ncbi:MAG: F0F1-type synthase delta subunit-like protein [Pedosphaera sp.]|nr:F0F1-type synthase delta subunit-like protein [Pedosphaera sp.]
MKCATVGRTLGMKISKQARRQARELLRSCLKSGQLDEGRVRLAVQKLLELRPRGYLAILIEFYRRVKLEVWRRTARVESAVPLPSDLQAAFQNRLINLYGPGLYISFSVNPALIGGVRIQVGWDIYDGSVQGRLARLERMFD